MSDREATTASRREMLMGAGALALVPSGLAAQSGPYDGPDVIDLRPLMGPVKDQGVRATCMAFAVNAILEAAIKRDLGRAIVLSEEFAIYLAQRDKSPPFIEWMADGDILQAAEDIGSVEEADWPYQPSMFIEDQKCDVKSEYIELSNMNKTDLACYAHTPPADILAKASLLKVKKSWALSLGQWRGWEKVENDYQHSLCYKLMRTMNRRRGAILMGARLMPDGAGWPESGELSVPEVYRGMDEAALDKLPSHFVALTGFDRTKQRFYFKNSQGTKWGNDGYGWISFNDIVTPFVVSSFQSVQYV